MLLISDSLFRINHVAKRKRYAELVEGVREGGGEALVGAGHRLCGSRSAGAAWCTLVPLLL